MSRHSHWAKIKRGKGAADAQRGKEFSKLARLITATAREGGGDPAFNFKLRLVVDRAKAAAMSRDAIDRAIARGAGGGADGAVIETVMYEGFAPGGAAVLIECLTDNRNRALGEVKAVFTKQSGTLGGEGSVRWQFAHQGVIRTTLTDAVRSGAARDALELACIEAGAEDVREEDGALVICTAVTGLAKAQEVIQRAGLTMDDAGLEWVAKQHTDVAESDRERFEVFLSALDDCDDVQEVYTNARGY
ncbi:YebC/PmpR family DNA-binding transcriptional regulator [Candidatus Uhrbacteria bacterium]|nr:YebC/PmpR family DNA-binding transcriptional regulator [Candidatus Uhrbacteria bacterium]